MAEFFGGLATLFGLGYTGLYVAFGAVCFFAIAGVCAGAVLYKRRRNLKNSLLSPLTKKGNFERAKVKNTTKFYNFLKNRKDAMKGSKKEKETYTAKPAEKAKTLKSTAKKEKEKEKEKGKPAIVKVDGEQVTGKTNVEMDGKVSKGGKAEQTKEEKPEIVEEIVFTDANEQEDGMGL